MTLPPDFPPLPVATDDERLGPCRGELNFVDEQVVSALISGFGRRAAGFPEDLVLPADKDDFAGWKLSSPQLDPNADAVKSQPPTQSGAPQKAGSRGWLVATGTLALGTLIAGGVFAGWPGPELRSAASAPIPKGAAPMAASEEFFLSQQDADGFQSRATGD